MERMNKDEKRSSESFLVEIKQTQNQTWQGSVTWIDEKKTMTFRSALELLKLIGSAVEPDEESVRF